MTAEIIPFEKPTTSKDVCDMTADEILEFLRGKFKAELIVIGYDEEKRIILNTNASYERSGWVIDRAKRLLMDDQ